MYASRNYIININYNVHAYVEFDHYMDFIVWKGKQCLRFGHEGHS